MFNRDEFVRAYSKVIGQSWTDETYMANLLKNPRAVLAEAGLEVPSTATLNVVQGEPTADGSIEDQVARWSTGEASGVYELYVPIKPAEFALNDEQLASIAGGDSWCCCCCPCCCCT